MPVCAEMRSRSSRNPFHAVSVFGRRFLALFFLKSVQTSRLTPTGSDHGRGCVEEPSGSEDTAGGKEGV